jgi:hypothetical protein
MPRRKKPSETHEEEPKSSRPRNPGLPNKETIIAERPFTSPKGKRYRIIKTTEKDPYDPPDDQEKGS